MTFNRRWSIGLLSVVALISLSACTEDRTKPASTSVDTSEEIDHSTMNHSSSGEIPATLKS